MGGVVHGGGDDAHRHDAAERPCLIDRLLRRLRGSASSCQRTRSTRSEASKHVGCSQAREKTTPLSSVRSIRTIRAHDRGVAECEHDRIRRLPHREGDLIRSGQRRVELDVPNEFGVGRTRRQRAGVGAGGESVQTCAVFTEAVAHVERGERGELAEGCAPRVGPRRPAICSSRSTCTG